MKNVSDKTYRENQNTNFVFNNSSPPPENRALYEVMWKNKHGRVGQATDDNVIRRMRFVCRIN